MDYELRECICGSFICLVVCMNCFHDISSAFTRDSHLRSVLKVQHPQNRSSKVQSNYIARLEKDMIILYYQ